MTKENKSMTNREWFIKDFSEQIIESKTIINDFTDLIKKNFVPNSTRTKKINEIELDITYADLSLFTILYNQEEIEKNKEIEVVFKDVKNKENKGKYRHRINLNEIIIPGITREKLLNNIKNKKWEYKKLILSEKKNYPSGNKKLPAYVVKVSEETPCDCPQIMKTDKLNYYLNRVIKFEPNNYFTVILRLRSDLKSKDVSGSNFIFGANYPGINSSITLEIELKQNLQDIKKVNLNKELSETFKYCFGSTNDNIIFMISSFYKRIKTNQISIIDLYDLKDRIMNYYITPKVDGLFKQFYLINDSLFLQKYGIVDDYKVNIKKGYTVIGSGEIYLENNKSEFYPFHIYKIFKHEKDNSLTEIIKKTRIEYLNEFFSLLIDSNKNDSIQITIKQKEIIGPFDDKISFYENLYKVSVEKNYDFITDGFILVNNYNLNIDNVKDSSGKLIQEEIQDLKIKEDNTIDLLTYVTKTKTNKNSNEYVFSFSYYSKGIDNNSQQIINLYEKPFIVSREKMFLDNDLSMLVHIQNGQQKLFPPVFISEYSLVTHEIFPRLDKTAKMILTKTYYGNAFKIICQSRVIKNSELNFSPEIISKYFLNQKSDQELDIIFEDIKKKYLLDIEDEESGIRGRIKNKNLNVNVLDDDDSEAVKINYIITPLNKGNKWYKKEKEITTRTALNILTNFNKTNNINLSINPFVTKENYENLLCIYAGRGGDMGRFVNNNIKHVVAVDVNKDSLKEFVNRRDNYSKTTNEIFSLQTIVLELEDRDFIKKFNNSFKTETFDVIDIQLGIHFSLMEKTENHILNILKTFSNKNPEKNKKPHTKILISTNHKENILKLFEKKKQRFDGGKVSLKIDEKHTYNIELKDNETKMSVFYSESMSQPMDEYLISSDYMKKIFNKHGFKLVSETPFIIPDKELLDRLQKSYQVVERKSTIKFINSLRSINVTEDIEDLMSIFIYYVFEF